MIISNGYLITMDSKNTCIENGAVRIENGVVTRTGPSEIILKAYPEDTVTDAEGMVIMPGNICAHTHFYGAFARGLGIPGEPPGHFLEILKKLWWNLDSVLEEKDIYYSSLVCLIDAVRHGTTTLVDHHASPRCIDGSLDIISSAVLLTGLRACLCYEVTDRNGEDACMSGIRENVRFLSKYRINPHPSLAATFGLHASFTVSDKTLERCRSEAETSASGFHLHAAEALTDQIATVKKHGLRVIDRLHRHGILGRKTLLAHCVHVDQNEIDTIASSKSFVSHQPRSNMNNAVGTAPVGRMLEKQIPVVFGNDGFSNSMWDEWKASYLVHKLAQQDPREIQGFDIIKMGVTHNSRLLQAFWPDQLIGTLETGASADIILVDYRPFTALHSLNFPWHVLFGFETSMIHSTMAQGRWLMKNRVLTMLDQDEILANARDAAEGVWNRFESRFKLQ
jgi:putative selenium metabolism protein SsnA